MIVPEKTNVFKKALNRTRQKINSLISRAGGIEQLDFDDLEEILISADFPVDMVIDFVEKSRDAYPSAAQALDAFFNSLKAELDRLGSFQEPEGFSVFLLLGSNGTGKTTTCAKLAAHYSQAGRKVLLVAGDTYRAAGSEQLELWAERLNLDVVSQERNAHPGAVLYDAINRAKAKNYDLVIADTAGRLHTQKNLIEELKKVRRSALKLVDEKELLTFLVLDANFGQNAVQQAEKFSHEISVDYLIVSKTDSSSKAGAVLAAAIQLKLPIAFIGTGEGVDDLQLFDAEQFVAQMYRS